MADNSYLIPIIVMMLQNIIKSQKPVFWVDFFNQTLDPIFVQGFFDLRPELQFLVRKFFFQFLVESEFGNVAVIVLRERFVKMCQDELLEVLNSMKHHLSFAGLNEDLLKYDPPCLYVLSQNMIAQICRNCMDDYLDYIKQITSRKLNGWKYIKKLLLLVNANFWVMQYLAVEKDVHMEFKIMFEITYEDRFQKAYNKYESFYERTNRMETYNRNHRKYRLYTTFFKRNPEFLELPMAQVHEELKSMMLPETCNKYSDRKIVPLVIEKVVLKPLDLGMIDLDKLIHFLMSCLDFTTPYMNLPHEQASQEVERDREDIMIQLRLAIVSILSSTFTKNNVCEIATEVFNDHVIPQIKRGCRLSPCEMSRTNVHYDCENCVHCRGCIDIDTVSKYGDNFKIVPNGFRKILLLTCFGEYNSFFAFVMFLCQINQKFGRVTNAPNDFQEIQKFLNVVIGLHSHYLPDLAVLLDRYYVVYYRQNVLSMTYSVYELFSKFRITMDQCYMLELRKHELNLGAPTRQIQSAKRDMNVFHERCADENATGLSWKHPQMFHIRTGGTPY